MSVLKKIKTYGVIPGIPGRSTIPGVSGIPGTPARVVEETSRTTVCTPNPACNMVAIYEQHNIGGESSSLVSTSGYTPSTCYPPVTCYEASTTTSTLYDAVPGSPGSVGIPGTSGTPAQLIAYLNRGWNSHSRSIDKIPTGQYLVYTVAEGVQGVMVSIGFQGMDDYPINRFSHSILVDKNGITVFEDGETVDVIRYTYDSLTEVRLYRQPDNRVVAVVTDGTETVVHVFNDNASFYSSIPMYSYCHMYIAGDAVTDAEYKTGEVHFGEA